MESQDFFDLPAVSKMLNISVPGLRIFIKRGELKAKKRGRSYFVTKKAIDEFLEPPSDPGPEAGADFLTVTEFSEKAGIPPAKIRQWLRDGILKGTKAARGRWMVDPKMIQWWKEIRKSINPKKWD
jgi:hypothetical protein